MPNTMVDARMIKGSGAYVAFWQIVTGIEFLLGWRHAEAGMTCLHLLHTQADPGRKHGG